MNIKILKSIFWTIPFLSFFLGYLICIFIDPKKAIPAPNLIGQSLQQAISIASQSNLSIKLLREQESADLAEGTILDQIPRPKCKIKPNQNLFVTISKRPNILITPNFLDKNPNDIATICKKIGIYNKIFWLKSHYPINTCIAQYPEYGQESENKKMITYLSCGNPILFIIPNLKNCNVSYFKQFLDKNNIRAEFIHKDPVPDEHICSNCKILDQKPIAGSIVDLNKNIYLQLEVQS